MAVPAASEDRRVSGRMQTPVTVLVWREGVV